MISLLPMGKVERRVLDHLKLELELFGIPLQIVPEIPLPDGAHDPDRGQFRARKLLKLTAVEKGSKVLGITDVDIYVPSLNFVFGLAQKGGRAALISTSRLVDGLKGPTGLREYLERCKKEAVHELGHTFGLDHCRRRKCVMHFSNSLQDTDVKSSGFCNGCARKVKKGVDQVVSE